MTISETRPDRASDPALSVPSRFATAVLILLGASLVLAAHAVAPAGRLALLSTGFGLAAVGAVALVARLVLRLRAGGPARAFATLFDASPIPAVLSDATGRILALNPAMRAPEGRGGPPAVPVRSIETCLARFGATDGLVHRAARAALAHGAAAEPLGGDGSGPVWLSVTAGAGDTLLWRAFRREAPGRAPGPDFRGAPFLHVALGPEGRIAGTNRPLGAEPGRAAATLDDLVTDPPLRPGGLHELAAAAGGGLARAILVPRPAGQGADAFLFPADPAEAQGATPDRFLDHLPVGLVRLRVSGEVVFANRAARALLGERAQPGTPLSTLVEGMGRSVAERLTEIGRGRGAGRTEIARTRNDERELFLQVTFNRVVLDGDISVIAVVSDATEMKSLEAQFVQSQKMQAVGQLAGGVAHDFNNLLTAISGHCDLLLLRHEAGDTDHGDLMQIRQNANRAASLVRQLLAFSRKQTLRPKILHLVETLSELSHLLNRLLGERVSLRIDNGPELWPVRVDERQFEQVVMNLVVNARDAMPNGGEVRIVTRNLTLRSDIERDRATIPAGEYVLVEVIDTGIGIPEDKLQKIFEPFYTTKKLGEGTGLGLSTAYGIVKQTGGFIFVTSVVGSGSTFSIYLPRHDAGVAAEVAAEPAGDPVRDLTGNGVVLLVEDEAPVRSFAARALRLRGYTVLEAASGEEALEITADPDQRIDLLVSDVVMPGIDGPTWVREARGARPDVKVIFVSGYAEDVFKAGGTAIEDAVFVPKPFSLNELTQRVKEVLEGR